MDAGQSTNKDNALFFKVVFGSGIFSGMILLRREVVQTLRRLLIGLPMLAALLAISACVRVPQVEQGLRTLHFDSATYVVQSGDTLESIAFRYRIGRDQLLGLNPHVGEQLIPGNRLVIRRDAGPGGYQASYTGQGWFRDSGYSESPELLAAGSRDVGAVAHATREKAVDFQGGWNEQASPDVEIQASYREPSGIREDILSEEEFERLRELEGAPERSRQIPESFAGSASVPGWAWPVAGDIVREYAPERVNGQGIDIAGHPGDYVVAAAPGTVQYTGRDMSDSGNLVIIRHADGLLTAYSHLNDFYVAENEYVAAGQDIASLGWNSNRESVLHFEVRKQGKPVNPLTVLPLR